MQSGLTGQATGTSDFVGRGDNAGRLVGNQRAGQLSTQGTGTDFGGFGNRGRGQNASNRFGNQQRSGTRQTTRVIRPRQKIAFSYPQRPAADIDRSLETRMTRLMQGTTRSGTVSVAVDAQGVATLSGTVDSPEAKRLAAIMVRLEPGVREVDNQLEVAEPAETQN